MKNKKSLLQKLTFFACLGNLAGSIAQNDINVEGTINILGKAKPIPVSMSGFSGEVAQVLQFDLYVQGFSFTGPESAQYLISGSNNSNVQGRLTDPHNKSTLLSKAYSGASVRRQAHALADDIVQ